MEKLFENIKEFTYDVVGYILPGIIVVYLGLICIMNDTKTPIQVLFTNLNSFRISLDYMVNMNIVFLLVTSYIGGHIISFISVVYGQVTKLANKMFIERLPSNLVNKVNRILGIKNKANRNIKVLEEFILKESKGDKILNLLNDRDDKIHYLLTKASTNSRFEGHNDLIQKYIYKSRLYSSISCIFLLLSIDSFIVIINMIFIKHQTVLIYNYIVLIVLSVSFWGFFCEYKRHLNLRYKECYIYLINKLSK